MSLPAGFAATADAASAHPLHIATRDGYAAWRDAQTESLQARISKASYEMSFKDLFDHIIINDKLERACKEAETIVRNFLSHKQ